MDCLDLQRGRGIITSSDWTESALSGERRRSKNKEKD